MRVLVRLTVLALVMFPTVAQAELTCVADSEGIRHLYPHAYPAWTEQMPGFKNKKCWFPAPSKQDKKWKPEYFDKLPDVEFEHIKTSKEKKPLKPLFGVDKTAPVTEIKNDGPNEVPYVRDTSPLALEIALHRYAEKLRQKIEDNAFMLAGLIK